MSIEATEPPRRDPDRERRLLMLACSFASHSSFVEHCTQRLAQGDRDFGDRWARIGLPAFARELGEEAADLAAWAVLADQAIDLDPALNTIAVELRVWLLEIARLGAEAHHILILFKRRLAAAYTSPAP